MSEHQVVQENVCAAWGWLSLMVLHVSYLCCCTFGSSEASVPFVFLSVHIIRPRDCIEINVRRVNSILSNASPNFVVKYIGCLKIGENSCILHSTAVQCFPCFFTSWYSGRGIQNMGSEQIIWLWQ